MTCKLICLPYAGGSSLVFSEWRSLLPSNIEIVPIELKGRGKKSHEKPYEDVREAASDILEEIKPIILLNPYCFFGQSLGGLIAYEILELIYQNRMPLPFHAFFSAIFPPHINKINNKLHELSDSAFTHQLTKWASLPTVIAKDQDMLKTWLPILKSDYKLLENYHFKPKFLSIPVDFSIIKGKDDHWLSPKEYSEWQRYSNRKIEFHEIQGGHLFIHEQRKHLLTLVNTAIQSHF
jgi:medium-chain acyl-[acyl-carrier-protein] hydrolase